MRFDDVVELFADDLDAAVGWRVERVTEEPDLDVRWDPTLGAEAYRMRVSSRVVVSAADGAGAFYALGALRQLGPHELWGHEGTLTEWPVPHVEINDAPQFAWRGAHLDVARHFFDGAVVRRFIDQVAAHRLNRLHLHLNDDQGWRVEVPAWPRLTEVGAWRPSSPAGHESEGRDDGQPHGGFFTRRELVELRHYAARRHVVIVPEIDLPGHAQAAIAAYPELGSAPPGTGVWTRWGISEHVLNLEPITRRFARDVVRSVAELFPGAPFHIGGDECPTREWEVDPRRVTLMAEHHLADERGLQGLFTAVMAHALRAGRHEVLAWDEVLDAVVPDGTVIVAWRNVEEGRRAARRGLDVIMAPMQWVYFDWLNSDAPGEPVAIGSPPRVTTWERVYAFRVVPDDFDAAMAARVRGAQAQLWTEYIATRDHLDYMAFPRLSAFAEVVWGTVADLADFRPRLEDHLGRLSAMGVRFRPLDL